MFDVVAILVAFGTAFDDGSEEAEASKAILDSLLATCPQELREQAIDYAMMLAPSMLYALEQQVQRRVTRAAKASEGNAN